jgi:lambda family phage portal protein
MSPPLLDRLLAGVAPQWALERAVARTRVGLLQQLHAMTGASPGPEASAGGYTSTAGTDGFLSRWSTRPRSAAADTLRQLPDQRGQSRDLVRNNAIAASAINTNVARAIGTGLAYSPQPHLPTLGWTAEHGAEWASEVAAEFSLWADSPDCDWYGEQNFYDLQDLVTRARLESGDAFTVLPDGERTAAMPYALRLQVLEADRVGNPGGKADTADVAGGVRRGANGRVSGYHVYTRHPGGLWLSGGAALYAGDWVTPVGESGRRRMLHHFKRLRPEQPRGVVYLAPVMGLFKLIGDYTDAEVKAAVVSAFLTLIIETPTGAGIPNIFGLQQPAPGPSGTSSTPAQADTQDLAMGPAAVLGLAKGEKANLVNPLRPNPQFGEFVSRVVDQLGAGTFIGPEMLMKKFNTSYTAARAAFLDAWKHLLDVRTGTARDFCQPVVETWMAEAVATRRVRAPGFFVDPRMRWAYTRALWHGDSQGSLNPKDEVTAMRDAIDGRLTTHERASWEIFGTDWRDVQPALAAELQALERDRMASPQKAGAPAAAPAGATTATTDDAA